MNHLKIFALILSTASMFLTMNAHSARYIPTQLEQFEKTGICIDCDLSEARIEGQHNYANLSQALLVKASLQYGEFNMANFSHAQMMYANLYALHASGSNFTSANLTGSSLRSANLSSANFTDANLAGADLSNANFARATVSQEQLTTAKSLSCAIMPDGTRHAANSENSC